MTSPRFPFPIANAWYAVALSRELADGDVRPLRCFGHDLVLFRTAAGAAKVLDAFCPHLGAHLGWGGTVDGEDIVCPFHAWKFNGDGVCTNVPYASKIPPKAIMACWPVVERNGVILVWYHAEKQPPAFDVPVLEAFHSPAWAPYRVLRWQIRTHNQEVMENVIDAAHFRYVHCMENPPPVHSIETTPAMLHVKFFAEPNTNIDVTMHGLGMQVIEEHSGLGSGYEFLHATYITPTEGDQVEMLQLYTVQRAASAADTQRLHDQWGEVMAENLEKDIAIWNHKVYIDPPILAENDGPVGAFRRWAQQFYSRSPQGVADGRYRQTTEAEVT